MGRGGGRSASKSSASESVLNSKIQTIKKTAIYFHCGGLDLYPATHRIPG